MATQEVTGTGRPVDALICPVSHFTATRPGICHYYGYAGFANLLDYSACVIPVTAANMDIDRLGAEAGSLGKLDGEVAALCESRCHKDLHD